MGWATTGLGERVAARGHYEDALARARHLGLASLRSLVSYSLSKLVGDLEGPLAAVALVRESYEAAGESDNRWRATHAVLRLAWIALRLGLAVDAVRLLAAGTVAMQAMGGSAEHRASEDREILDRTKALLSPAEFDRAWSEGEQALAADLVERTLDRLAAERT
jgi:hypothetical protein